MQKLMAYSFFGLVLGAVPCEAGQYEGSNVYPTGIHEQLFTMSPEERKLAAAFQRALAHLGDLPDPLVCERPLDPQGTEITRPQWKVLDALVNFEVLKLTVHLRQQQYNRNWAYTPQVEKNLRDAIANGSLQLSTTAAPILPNGQVAQLLRVQYSPCTPQEIRANANVTFFIVNGGDMTKLQIIKGLGRPTDVFLYRGQAYFDSHSYRDFDNSFQIRLPKPQSEIYVHSMSAHDRDYYVRRARLLYWDEELTKVLRQPRKKPEEKNPER